MLPQHMKIRITPQGSSLRRETGLNISVVPKADILETAHQPSNLSPLVESRVGSFTICPCSPSPIPRSIGLIYLSESPPEISFNYKLIYIHRMLPYFTLTPIEKLDSMASRSYTVASKTGRCQGALEGASPEYMAQVLRIKRVFSTTVTFCSVNLLQQFSDMLRPQIIPPRSARSLKLTRMRMRTMNMISRLLELKTL